MPPLKEDRRREQIKRAALKVFARRGLVGTKMSMIADEAGISQGLSYRYFASKDELFVELVSDALAASRAAVEGLADRPGTPLDKLRALTEAMLDEDNRGAFLLVQQVQTSDEVPDAARRLLEAASASTLVDPLVPLFERGQREGQLAAGDPRELLTAYLTVVTGLMVQHVPREAMPRVELLLRIVTR